MSHRENNKTTKNTLFAMIAMTCLFLGIIGYGLFSSAKEAAAKGKREESFNNTPLFVNSFYGELNEEEGRLKQLEKINKEQAAEIYALRQERSSKLENIHEIKAHLFKQESDPKDKARISELLQKNDEKEQEILALSAKLETLKIESSDLEKKVQQLNLAKVALIDVIESHRGTKEQEQSGLKQKIQQLRELTYALLTQLDLRDYVLNQEFEITQSQQEKMPILKNQELTAANENDFLVIERFDSVEDREIGAYDD